MLSLIITYLNSSKKIMLYIFCTIISVSIITAQKSTNKIRGMSFLGPHEPNLEQYMIDAIDTINADWIAIVPEATLKRSTLKFIPDHNNPNWSETKEGIIEMIKLSNQSNKRIMLKPQIVLDKNTKPNTLINKFASYVNLSLNKITDKTYGAKWRGDLAPISESDWQIFESSYTQYILSYATIARDMEVDIFCIGTELRESAIQRPEYWKSLIKKVKNIYHGSIIYSANWDEYEKITFWRDLDYIGTNAYYPISNKETPSVEEAFENWQQIRKDLYAISKKYNRKIIITEYGYRNVSFTGLTPWIHDSQSKSPKINNEAQTNLYKAFYKAIWKEYWIVGGFGWNWIYTCQHQGNTDFSVQGKPAQKVIASYYKQ